MTPLGHSAVAIIMGRFFADLSLWGVVLGALLPDVDFIFLFSDDFNTLHRSGTHSIVFILICSVVAQAIYSRYSLPAFNGKAVFLGGVSHLIIDSCMDNNPSNGIGVPLLWPFLNDRIQLLPLSACLGVTESNWSDPIAMVAAAYPLLLLEGAIIALALVMSLRSRGRRK